MVSIFLNKFRVIGNSVLEHIFDNRNTANFSEARHMRKHYCVCVKRITLCNCLCSSSSCFYASLIWNIQEFGAKNYLAAAVQCVHRNNPLETVSKRVYAVYTYSNCMINQLLYC